MKICLIEGCDKPAVGRGWCHKHYKRWQTNGDPLVVKRISGPMPLRERFDMQFEADDSGCWMWKGAISKAGYGHIKVDRKTQMAHRVSYQLHKGPIPEGLIVCHKCDVPACVNPDHLFLGTNRDNTQDMLRKKRGVMQRGENHQRVSISDEDAKKIIESDEPAKVVAERFGVAFSTIYRLRGGKFRKYLDANRRMGNV